MCVQLTERSQFSTQYINVLNETVPVIETK